jgi:argininosuccinate lyase
MSSRGTLATGRFRGDVDPEMQKFNASIGFDQVCRARRLTFEQELACSF